MVRHLVAALGCAAGWLACSDDEPQCVTVDPACKPIVSPPTFDAIYTNILKPSCSTGTGRCHGAGNPAAGLDMTTADSAFAGLRARVEPNDVGCSVVVRRIESSSPTFRMPPGNTPLSAAQRCAIAQWVAEGAKR